MWEFLSQLALSEFSKDLGGGQQDYESLWQKMKKDPSLFSGNTDQNGYPTQSAASQFAGMMAGANRPIYRPDATPNLGFGGLFR